MISFLRNLQTLENEVLNDGIGKYSKKTKEILKALIQCVESGSGMKSKTSRFYMKNFRLKNQELCKLWNQNNDDKSKSESTVRSQLSNLNKQLATLYGNDIDSIFLNQDEEGLKRISDTVYALMLNEKFSSENLFSKKLFPDDFQYSGVKYDFEDCKKEIQTLIRASDFYINEQLKDVDLDKMFYVRKILDEEVIGNTYRSINQIKLIFLKGLSKAFFDLGKSEKIKKAEMKNEPIGVESKAVEKAEKQREISENSNQNNAMLSSSDILNKLENFANENRVVFEDDLLSEKQQRNILSIIINVTNETGLKKVLSKMNPNIVREMLEKYREQNN